MKGLKGKKALVVDDEEVLREILVVQLAEHEVEALEASCANDALELLEKQVVDFIISDVRMPNGDGIDLLVGLQKLSDEERPDIVMMTGFADLTEEEAMQMGALKLFTKPFRNKELFQFLDDKIGVKEAKNQKS